MKQVILDTHIFLWYAPLFGISNPEPNCLGFIIPKSRKIKLILDTNKLLPINTNLKIENMKHFILTVLISSITQLVYGQADSTIADIKMISDYGSKNEEVTSILQFQNIDYFRVKFAGRKLKGKYFSMYCKEMWDGKLRKVDTLINSKTNTRVGQISEDTLSLTVFGNRVDKKLKLFFRFPMVGLNKKYDALISDDYSLRDIGTDVKIKNNESFPAFAYILPYKEGNWKMYCAVADSGEKVEDWGTKFKIKHYLIFEMKFED